MEPDELDRKGKEQERREQEQAQQERARQELQREQLRGREASQPERDTPGGTGLGSSGWSAKERLEPKLQPDSAMRAFAAEEARKKFMEAELEKKIEAARGRLEDRHQQLGTPAETLEQLKIDQEKQLREDHRREQAERDRRMTELLREQQRYLDRNR